MTPFNIAVKRTEQLSESLFELMNYCIKNKLKFQVFEDFIYLPQKIDKSDTGMCGKCKYVYPYTIPIVSGQAFYNNDTSSFTAYVKSYHFPCKCDEEELNKCGLDDDESDGQHNFKSILWQLYFNDKRLNDCMWEESFVDPKKDIKILKN